MNFIVSHIGIAFLKMLGTLPIRVLFIFSSFIFFLLYRVFRYRRKVVMENLERSFPEKTRTEIKTIEKDFYIHLSTLFAEIIKGSSCTKTVYGGVEIKNAELLDKAISENSLVLALASHQGNWEWHSAIIPTYKKHDVEVLSVYRSLSNLYFDGWIKKSREKFDMCLIDEKKIFGMLRKTSLKKQKVVVWLAPDQSPSSMKRAIWLDFLNQDTAFVGGTKTLINAFRPEVIYLKMHRKKRGKYILEIISLPYNKDNRNAGDEVLKQYVQILEKSIREQPYSWVWSHKRWKQKREDGINGVELPY